jgi:hypothetical protein
MKIASLSLSLMLTGCATTQLARTTVNVAGTIEEIQISQVVENFGRFKSRPGAMPSMVSLSGGTVQVVNTVTPAVTFPLSHMFARTVSATPATTTTMAGGSSTISGTVTWQQNFNIVPIVDPFVLRNLAALYGTAVGCADGGRPNPIDWGYQPPRVYDRSDELVPDPYFLEKPNCALCVKDAKDPPKHDNELRAKTSPNAEVFGTCWLNAERDTEERKGADSDRVYLGTSHGWRFWVSTYNYASFTKFMILLLQPSPAPARFASVSVTRTAAKAGGAPIKKPSPAIDPALDNYDQLIILPRLAPGPAEGTSRSNAAPVLPGIQPNPQ